MAERLTKKTDEGIWVNESLGDNALKTLYRCYGKEPLPDYSNCDEGYLAMEKLMEYEDADAEGKLVIFAVQSWGYGLCYPAKLEWVEH